MAPTIRLKTTLHLLNIHRMVPHRFRATRTATPLLLQVILLQINMHRPTTKAATTRLNIIKLIKVRNYTTLGAFNLIIYLQNFANYFIIIFKSSQMIFSIISIGVKLRKKPPTNGLICCINIFGAFLGLEKVRSYVIKNLNDLIHIIYPEGKKLLIRVEIKRF